jgi:hypothetical protein
MFPHLSMGPVICGMSLALLNMVRRALLLDVPDAGGITTYQFG